MVPRRLLLSALAHASSLYSRANIHSTVLTQFAGSSARPVAPPPSSLTLNHTPQHDSSLPHPVTTSRAFKPPSRESLTTCLPSQNVLSFHQLDRHPKALATECIKMRRKWWLLAITLGMLLYSCVLDPTTSAYLKQYRYMGNLAADRTIFDFKINRLWTPWTRGRVASAHNTVSFTWFNKHPSTVHFNQFQVLYDESVLELSTMRSPNFPPILIKCNFQTQIKDTSVQPFHISIK